MKYRNWYFQGWERRKDEDGRNAYVYTGEYYRLQDGFKLPVLGAGVLLIVLYLTAALLPSSGGMWRIAAVPQLLELIPLIYLVLGGVCLARCRGDFTFRDWYASWRRLERSALFSTVFCCLMAGVEIVYLILFAGEYTLPRELLFLLNELLCAGLSVFLFVFIRKHPCTQTVMESNKEE